MDEKLSAMKASEMVEMLSWQAGPPESSGLDTTDAEQKFLAADERIAILEQQLAERDAAFAQVAAERDAAYNVAAQAHDVVARVQAERGTFSNERAHLAWQIGNFAQQQAQSHALLMQIVAERDALYGLVRQKDVELKH